MESLLLFTLNSTFSQMDSYKTILIGQIATEAFLSLFHSMSWCYYMPPKGIKNYENCDKDNNMSLKQSSCSRFGFHSVFPPSLPPSLLSFFPFFPSVTIFERLTIHYTVRKVLFPTLFPGASIACNG